MLTNSSYEELVGGAELQYILLSEQLKNYFDVSFIVFDHGQDSHIHVNNINIFKACKIKNFSQKNYFKILISTLKALNYSKADIFMSRSGRIFPAIVAFYCLIKNKKFVYSIASDMDVDKNNFGYIELILYKFIINRANIITSQTQIQKNRLKNNFGKDSYIMKNVYPLTNKKPQNNLEKITILWVSTIKKGWKNPELYLELAKQIPNSDFVMIGGPSNDDLDYYEKIKRKAKVISNLEFKGYIPYNKIGYYFSNASIFVNTSTVEGFPNTFLQAWESYTPVVSLYIDPDEVICKNNLGFHSEEFDRMVKDIKILINNHELRNQMAKNGRKFIEKEHNINNISYKYLKLLTSLITKNQG